MAKAKNKLDGDLTITGNLKVGSLSLPDQCVGDDNIDPDNPLGAANLEHQYELTYTQGTSTTTAVDERKVVHVATAPGEVIAIRAGVVDALVGDATIEVDLLKNGTSILSSTAQLDSTQDDYENVDGTVDDPATYDDGDVLEVDVDVTTGTGTVGKGIFVVIVLRESASA